MRNALDKSCRQNQTTNLMFSNFFLSRALHDIMFKNIVHTERPRI